MKIECAQEFDVIAFALGFSKNQNEEYCYSIFVAMFFWAIEVQLFKTKTR